MRHALIISRLEALRGHLDDALCDLDSEEAVELLDELRSELAAKADFARDEAKTMAARAPEPEPVRSVPRVRWKVIDDRTKVSIGVVGFETDGLFTVTDFEQPLGDGTPTFRLTLHPYGFGNRAGSTTLVARATMAHIQHQVDKHRTARLEPVMNQLVP